jgi:hypothetical protein
VVIAVEGTNLPFDVITERTIFYRNDIAGVAELGPQLADAADAACSDSQPDNPIYRFLKRIRDSIIGQPARIWPVSQVGQALTLELQGTLPDELLRTFVDSINVGNPVTALSTSAYTSA